MSNFRTGIVIGFLGAAVIALVVALVVVLTDGSNTNESARSDPLPVESAEESVTQPDNEPASRKPLEPPPEEDDSFGFRSPSENIICRMDAEGALCGIGDFDYEFPPDRSCQLAGYGQFFYVGLTGPARLECADGLPAPPNSPTLAYGQFARFRNFECGSSQQGVYCENRFTGKGFAVSRERYSIR